MMSSVGASDSGRLRGRVSVGRPLCETALDAFLEAGVGLLGQARFPHDIGEETVPGHTERIGPQVVEAEPNEHGAALDVVEGNACSGPVAPGSGIARVVSIVAEYPELTFLDAVGAFLELATA